MKIVITPDGQKRYRFEDKDLHAQKEFERCVFGFESQITKLVADLLSDLSQRKSEAWRVAMNAIKEIDPDFSEGHLSYNNFTGEFAPIKGDNLTQPNDEVEVLERKTR